ncbi:MAG: UDP-glucose/GDP-mannose dehydrogenase family protein [Clostridia bacterium]|nr:UDP-glucose/GDP-mannose dehydrogenase family protein [Clostridia bacterium]
MDIVVTGTGYVGLVAGVCFADVGHNVTCIDVNEARISLMQKGISPIYEKDLQELMQKNAEKGRIRYTTDYANTYKNAEVIFIGVGTPENPDGSANLEYVEIVSKQIAENIENDCLVVVKSTVPVGTNERVEKIIKDNLKNNVKVEVASNPEFLAQGNAVHDMLHAKRVIIGIESKSAEKKLNEIYKPFNLPIVSMNRRSAEMVKYACNSFLALKISYMNEIANLCKIVGADIEEVAKGMSYDDRIGAKFLNAGIGYGGSCFPKDTKALNYLAEQNGYELKTVKATIEVNEEQRKRLIKKAKKCFKSFEGKKIAVLGLAFKPETDDLREAPSIDNIKYLVNQGANVYTYDPIASNNFKEKYDDEKIMYAKNPTEALKDADACFIFTEWNEIKDIKPEQYKELMSNPSVFDGRNIYDINEMKENGIDYHSIGR